MCDTREVYEAVPGVMAENIDEEVVALHLGSGHYYRLNATGARIWALLISGKATGEIASCICDEFEVEPQEVLADIKELIAQLLEHKLLQKRPR